MSRVDHFTMWRVGDGSDDAATVGIVGHPTSWNEFMDSSISCYAKMLR
jgi:hypothetical protein